MTTATQGKRERNRQRWPERIAAWERSGLSQREFIEQQRLNTASFQRWKRIYRHEMSAVEAQESRTEGEVAPASRVGLLAVEVLSEPVASDSGVTVQLEHMMQIRLERNFDTGTLARVLQVICSDRNGR